MSEFSSIMKDLLTEWAINEAKEILFWGIVSIAAIFIGKFIIWPKIIEILDRINGR